MLMAHLAFSQIPACRNAEKYEERRFGIEMKPLVLNRVRGKTVIQTPNGQVRPTEVPQRVCLSLFSADAHKLVSSTTINQAGQFDFGNILPGRYRLVARAEAFCTGNIAIEVAPSVWHRKRSIVVEFRLAQTDVCTSAEYNRK
jgi:hypothetical protein